MNASQLIKKLVDTPIPRPARAAREYYDTVEEARDVEFATEREIEAARDDHMATELQIDDDALVSRADDGAWVQAWVWVPADA